MSKDDSQFVINFIVYLYGSALAVYCFWIQWEALAYPYTVFVLFYIIVTLILQNKGYLFDTWKLKTRVRTAILLFLGLVYLYTMVKRVDYVFSTALMMGLFLNNLVEYRAYRKL